jgi:hypothetical protein
MQLQAEQERNGNAKVRRDSSQPLSMRRFQQE